jgi:hypothetical protein
MPKEYGGVMPMAEMIGKDSVYLSYLIINTE